MKKFAMALLLLFALSVVLPGFAMEDLAKVSHAESSAPFPEDELLAVEDRGQSQNNAEIQLPAPTQVIESGAICVCVRFLTSPVSRVGATCLRARQNAAAAARAQAVCSEASEGPCGSVSHQVDPCVALQTGGFRATATATFFCEICR